MYSVTPWNLSIWRTFQIFWTLHSFFGVLSLHAWYPVSSDTAEFERENKPRRRCFLADPSNLPVFCVFHLRLMTQIVVSEEKPRQHPGFFCLSCFVAFRLIENEVFGHGLRTDKRWSVRLQALGLHLNACIASTWTVQFGVVADGACTSYISKKLWGIH